MNLVETYITKIYEERYVDGFTFPMYEMVVDTDCYGQKKHKKRILVNESEYHCIKEKGYYLT